MQVLVQYSTEHTPYIRPQITREISIRVQCLLFCGCKDRFWYSRCARTVMDIASYISTATILPAAFPKLGSGIGVGL